MFNNSVVGISCISQVDLNFPPSLLQLVVAIFALQYLLSFHWKLKD